MYDVQVLQREEESYTSLHNLVERSGEAIEKNHHGSGFVALYFPAYSSIPIGETFVNYD